MLKIKLRTSRHRKTIRKWPGLWSNCWAAGGLGRAAAPTAGAGVSQKKAARQGDSEQTGKRGRFGLKNRVLARKIVAAPRAH